MQRNSGSHAGWWDKMGPRITGGRLKSDEVTKKSLNRGGAATRAPVTVRRMPGGK